MIDVVSFDRSWRAVPMPSHVRIFWWLSVGIVIFWICARIWFLAFPPIHQVMVLAQLPPKLRDATHKFDVYSTITVTAIWCAVVLGLARLAAFRRKNWARWAFAIIFALREILPFALFAFYSHQLDISLLSFFTGKALDWVVPILALAAIISVFSGDARDWFGQHNSSEPST